MTKKSNHNNTSYTVQTTSFPDKTNEKSDRRIRRWNHVHADRIELVNTPVRLRKYPIVSTSSTGFQMNEQEEEELQLKTFTPILDKKLSNERQESPLPMVENPIYAQLPPKKPPRTFQHEKKNDQKVPSSSSSNSNSPTFDIGT